MAVFVGIDLASGHQLLGSTDALERSVHPEEALEPDLRASTK